MNQQLVQKSIGIALILSAIILLVLKLLSLSGAGINIDAWANPENSTLWLIGIVIVELIFIVSRFVLGYVIFKSIRVSVFVFYPLVITTAISGLSGLVLGLVVLYLRLWQSWSNAKKT
jgi:hypothetical protein